MATNIVDIIIIIVVITTVILFDTQLFHFHFICFYLATVMHTISGIKNFDP